MIQILVVEANNGVFIKGIKNNYRVNGYTLKPSFNREWFVSESFPSGITEPISVPSDNYRYELKEEYQNMTQLKKILDVDEVAIVGEYNQREWKGEYEHLSPFYKLLYDVHPDKYVEVSFEIVYHLKIDKSIGETLFSLPSMYNIKHVSSVISSNLLRNTVDTMLFPDIVQEHLPCRLNKEDAYRIIRYHISTNIDPKWAKITSDYDFCFTVEKRLPLAEPYEYNREVVKNSLKSYNPKRYTRVYVNERPVKIFEMAPKPYTHYPLAPEFEAKDEKELKQKVETYLKEIMQKINAPLIECPHCKGHGVINTGV